MKVFRRPSLRGLSAVFAVSAFALAGGCYSWFAPDIQSVSLDKGTLTLWLGQSATLSATVAPEAAFDKSIEWSSDAPAVVHVAAIPFASLTAPATSSATITALAPGTATLTATAKDGGLTATCVVTVQPGAYVPAQALSLAQSSVTIGRGQVTDALAATVSPDTASDRDILWESLSPGVATVDAQGRVTAVGVGTADIVAKTTIQRLTARCTVRVDTGAHPVGVSLDSAEEGRSPGASFALHASVEPAGSSAVTWSSDDETVATVDASGAVSVVGPGRTAIRATTAENGFSASCEVYGRSLVSSWPLQGNLDDEVSGFTGTWKGSVARGGAPGPYFKSHGGLSGADFQYTVNHEDYAGGSDRVDPDAGGLHPELSDSDYVTVSFWIYWDTDSGQYLDGSAVPVPVTESASETPPQDFRFNIINKCVWDGFGWQVRYDSNGYEGVPADTVVLFLQHGATQVNGFRHEALPLVSNFSGYRGSWLHVVMAIDNVACRYWTYVNGVPEGGTRSYSVPFEAAGAPDTQWNTYHFSIGAFSHAWGGYAVNGGMRYVKYYHGLLGPAEAAALYAAEKS